jgi:hypothetical protein
MDSRRFPMPDLRLEGTFSVFVFSKGQRGETMSIFA